MDSILSFIDNEIDLGVSERYAAIIGETPSQGAKSPVLWNQAFADLGIAGHMHPMDVRPTNLGKVVEQLRADNRFIGGACTMPYKIDILPLIDRLEPEAQAIGAVNCIYRDGDLLAGANTDGAGALWSLEQEQGDITGAKVLLIGAGGAGQAVAAYVAHAIGSGGKLFLANTTPAKAHDLGKRLTQFTEIEVLPLPLTPDSAPRVDMLVNCTSVGFETMKQDAGGAYSLRPYTPLWNTPSVRVTPGPDAEAEYLTAAEASIAENTHKSTALLEKLTPSLVFDVIYQPEETILLSLAKQMGVTTLNGLPMNLEQAVIAFIKATNGMDISGLSPDEVRTIMKKAQ